MRSILRLLSVVAALAVIVVLVLRSRDRAGSGGTAAPAPSAAAPSGASEAKPPQIATPESHATATDDAGAGDGDADRAGARAALPTEEGKQSFDAEGAPTLAVRVVLPAGSPAGSEPAVFAFYFNQSAREQRSQVDDLVRLGRTAPAIDTELTSSAWAWRRTHGGEASLPVAPGAQEALVVAVGPTLVPGTQAVGLADLPAEPVELRPALGAGIEGKIVLPDDATDEERDPGGFDLDLEETLPRGGSSAGGFVSRIVRPHHPERDLSFLLRGLTAETRPALTVRADRFLDADVDLHHLVPGEVRPLEVALEPGASIAVTVRDEDGAPVERARLRFRIEVPHGTRGTTGLSDAEGRYVQGGLPGGAHQLWVQAPGYRAAHETVQVEENARAEVEVTLDLGDAIAGRVEFPDGTPAANAQVSARLQVLEKSNTRAVSNLSSQSVTTGEDGTFRLTGLDEGTSASLEATLVVQDATLASHLGAETGSSWKSVGVTALPGEEHLLLILAQAYSLPCRVTGPDGKRPAAVVQIQASRVDGDASANGEGSVSQAWGPPQDPDDSELRLEGLLPGDWSVHASAEGYLDTAAVRVHVPHEGDPVELVLLQKGHVAGVVHDPDGQPVADAQVAVSRPGSFVTSTEGNATTDEEGRFEVELDSEGIELTARHVDWAASEPVAVAPEPGESVEDLVLTLRVGATITGEVTHADGSPWVDSMVAAGDPASGGMMGRGEAGTTTDAAGHFVLEHVTPGKVGVFAMPSRAEIEAAQAETSGDSAMLELLGRMMSTTVTVADGETVHVVLGAEPRDPVRVAGHVTAAGAGVEAMVMVLAQEGPPMAGAKGQETDADGRFTLELDRPGEYLFMVQGGDVPGDGALFPVSVPKGPEYALELALPGGAVRGTVLGPDGEGAGGVSVLLLPEGRPVVPTDLVTRAGSRTDPDGTFAFEGVQPGRYVLRVLDESAAQPEAHARAGSAIVGGLVVGDVPLEGVVVHLPRGSAIEGAVHDAAGAPASGLAVFARDDRERPVTILSSVITDGQGHYTLEGLAPGRYTLFAQGKGRITSEAPAVAVAAGETASRDLVVRDGTMIVVTPVVNGEPVRARVSVVDDAGREWSGLWSPENLQDWMSEGLSPRAVRVGPLPPGSYTVTATRLDGSAEAHRTIQVREGMEQRPVKLRLR